MDIFERFQNEIDENKFFKKGEKVLVGCSGGPDSVALFHLMRACSKMLPLKLILVHFNHELRGADSENDEAFVRSLARRHRIPFRSGRGDVRKHMDAHRYSVEESARMLRYDFFLKISKELGVKKIVLGQHLEDQAETLMMRFFQGTGLKGLLGVRKKMKWKTLTVLRPLLPFKKQDVLKYLKINDFEYRQDKSNRSLRFVRNRIRKKIIPELEKQINPRTKEAVARMADILNSDNDFIECATKEQWKWVVRSRGNSKIVFEKERFLDVHEALQFRLFDRALKCVQPASGLSYDHWQALKKVLKLSNHRLTLPKNIDCVIDKKFLTLKRG